MTDDLHTCHHECPCHKGGDPTPDFIEAERWLVHPLIQTARGHVADEDWAGAEHELGLAVDRAKDLEEQLEYARWFNRLVWMQLVSRTKECARLREEADETAVLHQDAAA